MENLLSPEAIVQNPDRITEMLEFSGKQIRLRVLRRDDSPLLGAYLEGLSGTTRRWFSPHPFTMDEARRLCERIDYTQELRLIALTGEGPHKKMIAYFILTLGVRESDRQRYRGYGIELDGDADCKFAPSLADAYQNRGLGSLLARRVLDIGRCLGCKRMILQGGTQSANLRGIHFYEKLGFRKVGEFATSVANQDMVQEL